MARKTDQRHASIGGWDREGQGFRPEGGEWQPDRRAVDRALQLEFWRVAREQCPRAFASLRRVKVPASVLSRWVDYCQDRWHEPPREPEHLRFENALARWAVRHRLARDLPELTEVYPGWRPIEPRWIVDLARDCRLAWASQHRRFALREPRPDLEGPFDGMQRWVPQKAAPEFDPYGETLSQFMTRARAYALGELSAAKRLGAVRATRFSPDHLAWVARWRINGESAAAIARDSGVPESRLRRAVERMARTLELPTL